MKRTIIDEVKDRGIKKVRINHLDSEKKLIIGTLTPIEQLKRMNIKQKQDMILQERERRTDEKFRKLFGMSFKEFMAKKSGLTLDESDSPLFFDITYPESTKGFCK